MIRPVCKTIGACWDRWWTRTYLYFLRDPVKCEEEEDKTQISFDDLKRVRFENNKPWTFERCGNWHISKLKVKFAFKWFGYVLYNTIHNAHRFTFTKTRFEDNGRKFPLKYYLKGAVVSEKWVNKFEKIYVSLYVTLLRTMLSDFHFLFLLQKIDDQFLGWNFYR